VLNKIIQKLMTLPLLYHIVSVNYCQKFINTIKASKKITIKEFSKTCWILDKSFEIVSSRLKFHNFFFLKRIKNKSNLIKELNFIFSLIFIESY